MSHSRRLQSEATGDVASELLETTHNNDKKIYRVLDDDGIADLDRNYWNYESVIE